MVYDKNIQKHKIGKNLRVVLKYLQIEDVQVFQT